MKAKQILASILCCMIWFAAYSMESEPNDTKAQANTLTLNGSNSGAIGTTTDVDWWKVTTNKDGELSVTLTISNSLFCWVTLYDNNGTTVLATNYTNSTITISYDGLANGTVYMQVYPYYATQMPAYTISNTLTLAAFIKDAEPNNTAATALTLTQNSSTNGHIGYYYNLKRDTFDWYKVTTNADGRLLLRIAPSNAQFTWCYLFDNDGTTLLNSNYSNSTIDISTDGLAAGTYYLRVNCYYNSGFAPYTLTDSLFPPALANDAEPNGTPAQALNFSPNSSVTGHAGYYYNLKRDSADWYKIVTGADGMIALTITLTNLQFTWAYLYDNDGTTVLNSSYSNSSISFNTDGLAAGTYYVKVITYYNTGWAPYTLTNTHTQYINSNDGLSNDFAKLGKTLLSNATTQGHVGFRNNGGSRDLIDWWKINYTGSGNLTVTLNFETWLNGAATPFTWMQIYKDTLQAPLFNSNTNTTNLVAILTGLTKGYYYVAVFPYYNTQWSSYNLTPTYTENCSVVTVKAKNKVSGTTCTNSSVKINCTGNNGPYKVQLYRYDLPYGSVVVANGSGDAQFNNLPPGSYTGRGYADGATCGTLSSKAKLVPVPANPTTSNITQTSVKFNWTTLTSCIEQSSVQYRVVGSLTWTTKKVKSTNQNVTINGLTANTQYEWQVAATDTSAAGATTVSVYVPGPNFSTLLKVGASIDGEPVSLSVYPNPASSSVNVRFANGTEGEVTIRLFDVNGRTVFVRNENAASGNVNKELDLSGLNTGVYRLQVITANGSVLNQSIVKAKE